jgi:hypothetical protein
MLKKILSLSLIVSQLGFTSAALADVPASPAERALLQNVLTLKGLDLSHEELQRQISGAVKQYDDTAPTEGRTDRLQTALVDLELMTAQQASTFTAGVRTAEAGLESQQLPTAEAQAKALQAQLELFAKINPVGAQFAGVCAVGWSLGVAGVVAAITGAVLYHNNPTCHADTANGYSCQQEDCSNCNTDGTDGYGNECYCHDYTSTCYPTVCDKPDYYPDRTAGSISMIAGGVAAAAGVAILVFDRSSCF